MCIVHVFYCLDCDAYSRIPMNSGASDGTVYLINNVFCFEPFCSRRQDVLAPTSGSLSELCFYPGCSQDSCKLVSVPKSCKVGWQLDPGNVFAVRSAVVLNGW